jgi:hypothetical protein
VIFEKPLGSSSPRNFPTSLFNSSRASSTVCPAQIISASGQIEIYRASFLRTVAENGKYIAIIQNNVQPLYIFYFKTQIPDS